VVARGPQGFIWGVGGALGRGNDRRLMALMPLMAVGC
jgi:hypothetical protein